MIVGEVVVIGSCWIVGDFIGQPLDLYELPQSPLVKIKMYSDLSILADMAELQKTLVSMNATCEQIQGNLNDIANLISASTRIVECGLQRPPYANSTNEIPASTSACSAMPDLKSTQESEVAMDATSSSCVAIARIEILACIALNLRQIHLTPPATVSALSSESLTALVISSVHIFSKSELLKMFNVISTLYCNFSGHFMNASTVVTSHKAMPSIVNVYSGQCDFRIRGVGSMGHILPIISDDEVYSLCFVDSLSLGGLHLAISRDLISLELFALHAALGPNAVHFLAYYHHVMSIVLAVHCDYAKAVMPSAKGLATEHHSRFIGLYWGVVSTAFCSVMVHSVDGYLLVGLIFTYYCGGSQSLCWTCPVVSTIL